MQPGWGLWLLRIVLSTVVMVAVITVINPDTQSWLLFSEWQRMGWTLVLVLAGVFAYACSLLIMGVRTRHLVASGKY